jgi:uncharacterized repeat protein (TIGR01451 family)
MSCRGARAGLCLALLLAASERCAAVADPPPAEANPISIKTIAEVQRKSLVKGKLQVELQPATRVVPGDEVIYTVEVRNAGPLAADALAFAIPIPQHMVYVANSAVGPGAEVSYSIDGGRSFDRPENLVIHGAEGKSRPAVPSDYTHIRWVLRNRLKVGSVALARFRAVLQ